MKNSLLFLFAFLISIHCYSQEGSYYYGVNGKLVEAETEACVKKTVSKGIGDRYKITTRVKLSNEEWMQLSVEDIQIKSPKLYIIRGDERSIIRGKGMRMIEESANGTYIVKDFQNDQLLRVANCSQLIPLQFEGLVTVYYDNGSKKSESIYKDNQLQSNINWNSDSTSYINNIFYSTHTGPTFPDGNEGIQNFITKQISQDNILSPVQNGFIIMGAVVMENGRLDGIKVIDGSEPSLNRAFLQAMIALPESWGPATLDGKAVRYFIQLPFEIINNVITIMDFEITKDGRMFLEN